MANKCYNSMTFESAKPSIIDELWRKARQWEQDSEGSKECLDGNQLLRALGIPYQVVAPTQIIGIQRHGDVVTIEAQSNWITCADMGEVIARCLGLIYCIYACEPRTDIYVNTDTSGVHYDTRFKVGCYNAEEYSHLARHAELCFGISFPSVDAVLAFLRQDVGMSVPEEVKNAQQLEDFLGDQEWHFTNYCKSIKWPQNVDAEMWWASSEYSKLGYAELDIKDEPSSDFYDFCTDNFS